MNWYKKSQAIAPFRFEEVQQDPEFRSLWQNLQIAKDEYQKTWGTRGQTWGLAKYKETKEALKQYYIRKRLMNPRDVKMPHENGQIQANRIAQVNVEQQYQQMLEQSAQSIQITGTGQNETISIPGTGITIQAREILERVKIKLANILVQNHVKEIDTSPIQQAQAQGLAISSEPGKIHIDIQKIFNLTRQSMPPTVQTDGTTTDPDAINAIVEQISQFIEGEICETGAHEAWHSHDFVGAYESGQPFTSVQESPAEQFGKQIKQRYYTT